MSKQSDQPNKLLNIEFYLDAAVAHGVDSEPEHEVGDLQDHLRTLWGLLTKEQRLQFALTESVQQTLDGAVAGYEDALEALQTAATPQAVDGTKIPTAVIQINGGAVNCANADTPVRVIVLDGDTEGGDGDRIMEVNGGEAYVHDFMLTEPAESANGGIGDGIEADFVAYIVGQVDAA